MSPTAFASSPIVDALAKLPEDELWQMEASVQARVAHKTVELAQLREALARKTAYGPKEESGV